MEMFDWLMDQRLLKVKWNFAKMESGRKCVGIRGAEKTLACIFGDLVILLIMYLLPKSYTKLHVVM